jgi:anaerobic ribonucleoside-triphosphate reductase activating protein
MSPASTPIDLSRLHFPVTALGPGRRIGIWFQGCSIRCPGCISADTWAFRTAAATVADVLASAQTWLPAANGITISGGEPFDHIGALEALLRDLRSRGAADILVFSGYSLEALGGHLSRMGGLIDAIVTDPFERESPQTLRLRGSDERIWSRLGNSKIEDALNLPLMNDPASQAGRCPHEDPSGCRIYRSTLERSGHLPGG